MTLNWVFFSSFQILLQVSSSDWHFTIHSWCLPYPSGTNTFFCIFAFEKRCPLSSTSVVRTGYLVYRFQINTTPGQISSHWQTVVSKKPHKLFLNFIGNIELPDFVPLELREIWIFDTVFVGLRKFDTFNVDFAKLTLSLWAPWFPWIFYCFIDFAFLFPLKT